MPINDDTELSDNLENIEGSGVSDIPANESGIKRRVNIDFDDLEGLASSKDVEIEQVKIKDDAGKTAYKLDVKLNDLINKIFNPSHNFFIIVRDDKIIYANQAFLDAVDVKNEKLIHNNKFFNFIVKEDWNVLAKNIGEMLTGDISVSVRINAVNNRIIPVQFKGLYLPDNRHFTFVLMGKRSYEKDEAHGMLYDSVIGLPNYYLFEDRLQVAVNNENYCNSETKKNLGVAVVSIDNLQDFVQNGRQNIILRKMAEKLVFGLSKCYTIAAGIKYQYWILMPDVKDEAFLKNEVRKISQIFEQAVNDGADNFEMVASIGVSIFPNPSNSAHKLTDNAIKAVGKAKDSGGNKVVFAFS
ncbi:MAG: diguanylate cyclase [Lactobacillaceae bacterium]|jgi:GGDEF domain-containing protein|nr:diguanylate cyclase [Lactobacillaceae bacterium]